MPRICIDDDDTKNEVIQLSTRITTLEGVIMATLQEVKDAIAALQATTEEERLEVTAAMDALRAQVTALQEQVAAGTGVTAADLDGLILAVDAASAAVETIVTPEVLPVV